MGSYLEIYLQKKKKEGEKEGERLLLCSVSRANEIYSLFYDNNIGRMCDENYHEFTSDDIDSVMIGIDEAIQRMQDNINNAKEYLTLVSDKSVITDMLDDISSNKEYIKDLMNQKSMMNALYIIFEDINKYSSFDKVYWKIG